MKLIRDDVTFEVREDDYDSTIVLEVFQDNFYLPTSEYEIRKGDRVLDLGGHIGIFTVWAARKGALVFTYEPTKESFGLLLQNIKLNNVVENVEPYNLAVVKGNKGNAIMGLHEFNSGSNAIVDNPDWKPTETLKDQGFQFLEEVVTIDINEVLTRHKNIDYLKIDIEGSELEILKGTDLSNVKKIVMETHRNYAEEISNILKTQGFRVTYQINQGNLRLSRLFAINEHYLVK